MEGRDLPGVEGGYEHDVDPARRRLVDEPGEIHVEADSAGDPPIGRVRHGYDPVRVGLEGRVGLLVLELDLAGFSTRYGSNEALLLLDTLFAVAAADGHIDTPEVARLQRAATDLGVDAVLVTSLLQKHDPRHAQSDRRVPLDRDELVIGRASSCNVALHDPQVAQQHAKLLRTGGGPAGTPGGGWRVVDMGAAPA